MHELSYVVRFVNRAIEIAEAQHAASVRKLVVQVGEMTDVVPAYLHKYYPEAVSGTVLEGSELQTELLPALVSCGSCGKEYHPERACNYLCPDCGSGNGRILQGRQVVLKEVEFEITEIGSRNLESADQNSSVG